MRSTVGAVNYIKPNHDGEELYQYIYESQNAERPTNIHHETREVAFSDMRAVARDLSLAKNGMELHKISVPGDINWDDEEEVSFLSKTSGPIDLKFSKLLSCVTSFHPSNRASMNA